MNENPYLEKGYSLSETDARNMFALAYQSRRGDCKRNPATDALRLNVTESFAGDVAAAEYKHADPFSVVERIVVTSCADSLAHDTKRAIDEYTKCADIDPDFFQAFVNAGVLHEEMGDSDLAEKSYMRALEISPDNGMVLNNLAVVVLKRGALQEALDLAERAYALIGEHGSVILTYQRALEAVAKWLYETGKQDGESGERTKKPLEALNLYFKVRLILKGRKDAMPSVRTAFRDWLYMFSLTFLHHTH
jgi:tetratricopeptide (TPR) repeat protein